MSALRPLAWPFVPLYRVALAASHGLRRLGYPRQQRLSWPVISVGSLSAGGAGKTPVTIALAKLLTERGWTVDVLSRGYGRSGSGAERVQPEAPDAAKRFGDEPVLLAARSGVPVWVSAQRFTAGKLAEQEVSPGGKEPLLLGDAKDHHPEAAPGHVHLLDDGLQHRALDRQFDLVLVTQQDLDDTLLPAGNLREPLTALRRADAFAVREEEVDRVRKTLRSLGRPEVPVWTLRRALRFPAPLGVFGAGLRPLAFCGIARPENFATMLTGAGCGLVDTVLFPDHHRYQHHDLETLGRVAKQLQATGLITTEKDAVKLSDGMQEWLRDTVGPLMVVRLEVHFVYESPVLRTLEQHLRASRDEVSPTEARVR